MKTIVDHLLAKASAAESAPEDFLGEDGLRYCGRCRAPKEAWFSAEMQLEGYTKHPAECRCVRARREAEEAAAAEEKAQAAERRRAAYVRHLRAESGIPVPDWRFDREDLVWSEGLRKAQRYAAQWEEMRKNHIGLLLFGDVGTGKSLAAGCVANAVMERGVSARFVSAAEVVAGGREAGDALLEAGLLVLDDLGAERSTSFGRERIFQLVDRRLLTGRPLIVTTNLPLSAMQHPADLDDRRICDRILEVCVPVRFTGESMRTRAGAEKRRLAAKLLAE